MEEYITMGNEGDRGPDFLRVKILFVSIKGNILFINEKSNNEMKL